MADPVFGLTATAAKQVGQVVRQVLRTLPPTGRRTRRVIGGIGGGGGAQGRLTSALLPCDNSLTGATTFTFVKYVIDPDIDPQTDPVTMKEEVDEDDNPVETEGVNRSPLEAAVDGHVNCVKINGEWVPFSAFDVCPE